MNWGTVYAAEMGITLLSDIDRYTLEDALVTLVFHLVLADGSVEDVPMGVFEVSEANRLAKCLELKAYDFMLRFDKSFNGFETVGTAYDFITLCCKRCKVEFANKRAEIDAMPNGGVTLSVYTENDIETCRDVLFLCGTGSGRFLYYQQGGKTGTEKVREGSCDEGGAETPFFFQFFGFYYQIHGSEFHQQADADCRVLCSGSG